LTLSPTVDVPANVRDGIEPLHVRLLAMSKQSANCHSPQAKVPAISAFCAAIKGTRHLEAGKARRFGVASRAIQ
jgi:hypothetical protein